MVFVAQTYRCLSVSNVMLAVATAKSQDLQKENYVVFLIPLAILIKGFARLCVSTELR